MLSIRATSFPVASEPADLKSNVSSIDKVDLSILDEGQAVKI